MRTIEDAPGIGVSGFFTSVIIPILIVNIVGVIGYKILKEKYPDKVIPVNLDSDLVPKLRYGMLGLMSVSWMFSVACTAACTFVKVTHHVKTFGETLYGTTVLESYKTTYYLGLHGQASDDGVCASGDIEDDRIGLAYAFGVMNNILTTAALIGCLSVEFKAPIIKDDSTLAKKLWRAMGFVILASTWCCLFTFYIQESVGCAYISVLHDFECSLAGAGIAQIVNSILLIGICVLFFVLSPPTDDENEKNNENGDHDSDTDDSKPDDLFFVFPSPTATEGDKNEHKDDADKEDPNSFITSLANW